MLLNAGASPGDVQSYWLHNCLAPLPSWLKDNYIKGLDVFYKAGYEFLDFIGKLVLVFVVCFNSLSFVFLVGMCDHFADVHLDAATYAEPSSSGKVELEEDSSCPCVNGALLLVNTLSSENTKVVGRGQVGAFRFCFLPHL
jgi:hypothetical protein